jgi:hypothetical protein
MGQVYNTFAGFTFLVLVVSDKAVGECAAKTVATENRMAMAISITFFMRLKIKEWINNIEP